MWLRALETMFVIFTMAKPVYMLNHVSVSCDAAEHDRALRVEEKVNLLNFNINADRLALARIEHLLLDVGTFCLAAFSSGSIYASCDELFYHGNVHDGVYDIFIAGRLIRVFCEFSKGHDIHWLDSKYVTKTSSRITINSRPCFTKIENINYLAVIQRRVSNVIDFYKDWNTYEKGFGDLKGDFWLGLDNIHRITSSMAHELRVELEDWKGHKAYADYHTFSVLGKSVNYKLRVSGYTGNAGDALAYHNNHPFSTKDRDNDATLAGHCAKLFHGGWWYVGCHHANLNGFYFNGGQCDPKGISWKQWKAKHYSLMKVTMKIRPTDIAHTGRWLHGYSVLGRRYW